MNCSLKSSPAFVLGKHDLDSVLISDGENAEYVHVLEWDGRRSEWKHNESNTEQCRRITNRRLS